MDMNRKVLFVNENTQTSTNGCELENIIRK